MDTTNTISLNEVKMKVKNKVKHIPSTIQADTLFTFTSELKYLINYLGLKMIAPRYCDEDIRYLKIKELSVIAFPMKCFCDINLHRLSIHLDWYGYYGLAFKKEWGMKKGIQPVQYINPKSNLRKDFTMAFKAALQSDGEDNVKEKLQNYMLHELMYYKPYDGKIKNRNTGKNEKKCFTDECEWRFVPKVTKFGYTQIYHDKTIINEGLLGKFSDSMAEISEISLNFDYSDLKYIIVKTKSDFIELTRNIKNFELQEDELYELLSKIIIWDESKGDF